MNGRVRARGGGVDDTVDRRSGAPALLGPYQIRMLLQVYIHRVHRQLLYTLHSYCILEYFTTLDRFIAHRTSNIGPLSVSPVAVAVAKDLLKDEGDVSWRARRSRRAHVAGVVVVVDLERVDMREEAPVDLRDDLLVLLDELGCGRRRELLDPVPLDGEERGLVEEDVDVELPQDLAHVDAALARSTLLGLLLPHLHDLVRDRVAAEDVLAGGRRDVEARSEERGLDERHDDDDEKPVASSDRRAGERRASDGRAKLGISSSASL